MKIANGVLQNLLHMGTPKSIFIKNLITNKAIKVTLVGPKRDLVITPQDIQEIYSDMEKWKKKHNIEHGHGV